MKTEPQGQTPSQITERRTGAQALVETLKEQGVEIIFGFIGGQIMPLYDALMRDGSIRHITVGHEQGGTHMADGYARATGRTGVVMATSGPGATNLVTGLTNAMMDSTPLVAITGQVPTNLIGNDAFQEADMRGITMPITKHNYMLTEPEDAAALLAEAFMVASTGRPGPVLVDVPRDITEAMVEPGSSGHSQPVVYRPPYQGHPLQIERALKALQAASRPVILAGGGVIHAGASEELRQLAEQLDIPVVSTLMGLGAFPADNRLWLGMGGMHGLPQANLALHYCDLMLCVGTRLSDRITGRLESFAPSARLIHIDIDTSEIDKNLPASVPIVGHAKPVLEALLKGASQWESKPDLSAWHRQIDDWRQKNPLGYRAKADTIMPQHVIEEVNQQLDDEAIVVTGVGQHQMWTAQYYHFNRPRSLITSGGLGTMGFGLPAALGARVGQPERDILCIDGDGSFLMNIQELATGVRHRLPVVSVVLNNCALGMVRQWQQLFYDKRYAETKWHPPSYANIAQAFGALGKEVKRPEEVAPSIKWALEASRAEQVPAVLDVQVDPEECVLPMVPPGQPIAKFIPCDLEVM